MSSKSQSEQAIEPADTGYIVVEATAGDAAIALPETVNMLNAGFDRVEIGRAHV